jgi:hypothetical protein
MSTTWSEVQKNQRIPKNIFFSLGIPSGVQTGWQPLTVCNRATALIDGYKTLLTAYCGAINSFKSKEKTVNNR